MARRATVIREQRALEAPLLLVSAGDFCGDPGIIEMYRSRFLARTMIEAGYGAVAVGERDMNFGLLSLKAKADEGLPLICANLYQGAERVVEPFVIRKIHGVKIGVFALLGERPRDLAGLELRDPALEGRAVIERLRGKCDRVILLAHMERERLLAILPSLEGVDLVIRGHMREGEQTRDGCADTVVVAREHDTLPVFFAGDRGRNIGLVTFMSSWDAGDFLVESRLIHLDASVADDPVTAEKLKAYRSEESVKQRALRLSKTLTRDEARGGLVERYLGIDICRRCHADLMPDFIMSRHFRAFETLRRRGEETNPACWACHTTGYGRQTGYDPVTEKEGAPYLAGVQCEACHGPGALHTRGGSYAKAARESCRACHTLKWSPDFDFETYWGRAGHCVRGDSM